MCLGFGQMSPTEQTSKTTQLPDWLNNAAQQNVANAQNVTSQPFTPYTGQRVADLSGDEANAGDMLRGLAAGGNPYTSDIQGAIQRYMSAPGQTVSYASMLGGNADPSKTTLQDYMNPYTDSVLQPTLQAIGRQGAEARKGINASATMAGAFGDARHGIQSSNQMRDENTLVGNTVGQAYNQAFNTAAGLRGNDISNWLGVQNANNSNAETALQRAITGGSALQGLDQYNTGRGVDLANQLDKQGGLSRGIEQNKLDTNFSEFMRQQGYNPQMIQLMSQVLGMSPGNKEGTQTGQTEKPDNSGYALLGSLLGAGLKFV